MPPLPDPSQLKLLVFDLDGTLIDSRADLAAAVNAMLDGLGRPPLPAAEVETYVGSGARLLVERALGWAPPPALPGVPAPARPLAPAAEAELAEALRRFLDEYGRRLLDRTRLYPGTEAMLRELGAHFRLAVLTNKPEAMSRAILEGLGVAERFEDIVGGDRFACKKPDPCGLEALLAGAGLEARQAVMVGDSAIDVLTARAAGAWCCGVSYGFGAAGLALYPPDWMAASPAALAALWACPSPVSQ